VFYCFEQNATDLSSSITSAFNSQNPNQGLRSTPKWRYRIPSNLSGCPVTCNI